MLDQFGALGAGADQVRLEGSLNRARNGIRRHAVAAVHQRLVGALQYLSAAVSVGADNDPVRIKEISDSRALTQELGVRRHVKQLRRNAIEQHDLANPAIGVNRDGTLFDDDLITVNRAGNAAGDRLYIREIGVAVMLGRRAHCNKDGLAALDSRMKIVSEIEFFAAMALQQLRKEFLVDGTLAAPQRGQLLLIVIYQGYIMT